MQYLNPETGKEWDCIKGRYKHDRYFKIKIPCHPNASKDGFMFEHRLIMENILGRFLLPNEEVHHLDRNGHNNDPSNLKLLDGPAHRYLHGQEFAKKAWQTVIKKERKKECLIGAVKEKRL